MFHALIAFMSQKFLFIGAALGSVYVLWLGRSKEKVKEELKDVRVAYSQEKAYRDQVEEMVAKAQNVMAQQTNVECSVCDRDSINRWLSEQSHVTSADPLSKASNPKPLRYDTATISRNSSKDRRGAKDPLW